VGRLARHSAAARASAGLDFTLHMRSLCRDIAARLPEFRHLDIARVAIRVCQTRKPVTHGVHASLTPLRFQGGERTFVRRGRAWTIQPVHDGRGREMLYLLSFYLPRFCDSPLDEKLATIVHELWHISPQFDGDVRRLPGRCFAHGHSEQAFHREMADLARRWLGESPPAELYAFLQFDFRELRQQFGAVVGTRIPTPRIVLASHPQ
jgi:predicted metallopeptidase